MLSCSECVLTALLLTASLQLVTSNHHARTMSLLHALIAHEQTVVAEHSVSAPSTSTPATYNEACQSILRKLPAGSSRLTYAAGEILVHYVKRESWTAMCVADQQAGRRVPFTFLARALDRFMQLHGSAHDALQPPKPYEYQSSFGHQLAKMMVRAWLWAGMPC